MGVFGSNMSQSRVGQEHKGAGAYQQSIIQCSGISPGGERLRYMSHPRLGHAVVLLCLCTFGIGYFSTGQLMSSTARMALPLEKQLITSRGALADLTELEWDIVSS